MRLYNNISEFLLLTAPDLKELLQSYITLCSLYGATITMLLLLLALLHLFIFSICKFVLCWQQKCMSFEHHGISHPHSAISDDVLF